MEVHADQDKKQDLALEILALNLTSFMVGGASGLLVVKRAAVVPKKEHVPTLLPQMEGMIVAISMAVIQTEYVIHKRALLIVL